MGCVLLDEMFGQKSILNSGNVFLWNLVGLRVLLSFLAGTRTTGNLLVGRRSVAAPANWLCAAPLTPALPGGGGGRRTKALRLCTSRLGSAVPGLGHLPGRTTRRRRLRLHPTAGTGVRQLPPAPDCGAPSPGCVSPAPRESWLS